MTRRTALRPWCGTVLLACFDGRPSQWTVPVKIASGTRQDRVNGGAFPALGGHAGHMTGSPRGAEGLARLPEFRLLACFWGSVTTLDVGSAAGAPRWLRTLLVAMVVAACSLRLRTVPALAMGLIGWLLVTGFVVNEAGVLRLTGAGDLGRLVVLLAVALGGALAGRNLHAILTPLARRGRDRRRTVPRPAQAERIDATVGKR